MSIILPDPASDNEEDGIPINYDAGQIDEECFLLMYLMKVTPSEAYAIPEGRRSWIVARLMHQKQMEQEHMKANRIMSALDPSTLRG